MTGKRAFETAAAQFGQGEALDAEFAKVRGPIFEQLKQRFRIFATNMSTSNENVEPGWATYLKAAAFILPALCVWVGSCVLVIPKLREICEASGTAVPKPIVMALTLSEVFKDNLLVASAVILAALVLLEWRSRRWPRYRRLVFGIAAYLLNLIALSLITTLVVLAVVAGASLLHAR